MRSRSQLPSVSAVVVTKDPDPKTLAWTLSRLADQNYPVEEAVVVDSSETPVRARIDGIRTRVLHAPEDGISDARRRGMNVARGDYVVHMDEDSVLVRDDYLSDAITRLQDPDVAAAGGVAVPLRGNLRGEAIAIGERFVPSDICTRTLVHPRQYLDGEPNAEAHPEGDRGEDLTQRRVLRKHGRIERMTDQAVMRDLPSTRQKIAEQLSLGTIVGGVIAGIATTGVERLLNRGIDAVTDAATDA